jgi:hypothetical protein
MSVAALTPWTLVGQFASVRFTVLAVAEPGILARLIQPFARRDLTPDGFESTRTGATLRVDIAMQAMPAEMVHLIEGNLRQTVGVTSLVCRREITGSVRRVAA